MIPTDIELSVSNEGVTIHIPVSSSGQSSALLNQRMTVHGGYGCPSNVKVKKHITWATSMPPIPSVSASVLTNTQSYQGASFLQTGQAQICSHLIPPIPLQSLGA
jgi:hypothetical protein